MAELKTKPTHVSVADYLATIEDEVRRADAERVIVLMQQITGEAPIMWGTSLIGFGSYRYKYASGREGEYLRIGLSPRKEHLVLYGVIFYDFGTGLLEKLGKHKQGKGCLYIKKLSDIDMPVLQEMITKAWTTPHPAAI